MRGRGRPFWKRVLPLPLKLPLSFPKTFIMAPDGHQRRRNRAGRPVPPAAQKRPVSRRYGAFLCHPEEYLDEARDLRRADPALRHHVRHTATETRHTDQKKSFFGVGKSARGGGAVFTKKRPSPSRISFPGSDGEDQSSCRAARPQKRPCSSLSWFTASRPLAILCTRISLCCEKRLPTRTV